MTLTVLVLLLLVALDFARLYYMSMAVTDAARAGAQYGAQNRAAAANVLGNGAGCMQQYAGPWLHSRHQRDRDQFLSMLRHHYRGFLHQSPRLRQLSAELRPGYDQLHLPHRHPVSRHSQFSAV